MHETTEESIKAAQAYFQTGQSMHMLKCLCTPFWPADDKADDRFADADGDRQSFRLATPGCGTEGQGHRDDGGQSIRCCFVEGEQRKQRKQNREQPRQV